jgi:hypothetical protein
MTNVKIIRPRMVPALSYKLIGENGLLFNQKETFATEQKAEADAKRKIAALKSIGQEVLELAFETRLVPAAHFAQERGIRLVCDRRPVDLRTVVCG